MYRSRIKGDIQAIDAVQQSSDGQIAVAMDDQILLANSSNENLLLQSLKIPVNECKQQLHHSKYQRFSSKAFKQNWIKKVAFGPDQSHLLHGCSLLTMNAYGECFLLLTRHQSKYEVALCLNQILNTQTMHDKSGADIVDCCWILVNGGVYIFTLCHGLNSNDREMRSYLTIWRYDPFNLKLTIVRNIDLAQLMQSMECASIQDQLYVCLTSNLGSTELVVISPNEQWCIVEQYSLLSQKYSTPRIARFIDEQYVLLAYAGHVKLFALNGQLASEFNIASKHSVSGLCTNGHRQFTLCTEDGCLLSFFIDEDNVISVDQEKTRYLHCAVKMSMVNDNVTFSALYEDLLQFQASSTDDQLDIGRPLSLRGGFTPKFRGLALSSSSRQQMVISFRPVNLKDFNSTPEYQRETCLLVINLESQQDTPIIPESAHAYNVLNQSVEAEFGDCAVCGRSLVAVEGSDYQVKCVDSDAGEDFKSHYWSLCQRTGEVLVDPFKTLQCVRCKAKCSQFIDIDKQVEYIDIENWDSAQDGLYPKCINCGGKFETCM
ncbi:hypothetical protein MP228_007388 [Amoeboaphelidium protococcarum]|nr:hypothetical protein MP228_007388 [Amoeboaphelidium protococcarum]